MSREKCPKCGNARNANNLYSIPALGVICGSCLDKTDEARTDHLGQELDRWQLIARDLLGYLRPYTIEADPFLLMVHTELSAMPEIHIEPLRPSDHLSLNLRDLRKLLETLIDPDAEVFVTETGDDPEYYGAYFSIPNKETY